MSGGIGGGGGSWGGRGGVRSGGGGGSGGGEGSRGVASAWGAASGGGARRLGLKDAGNHPEVKLVKCEFRMPNSIPMYGGFRRLPAMLSRQEASTNAK